MSTRRGFLKSLAAATVAVTTGVRLSAEAVVGHTVIPMTPKDQMSQMVASLTEAVKKVWEQRALDTWVEMT